MTGISDDFSPSKATHCVRLSKKALIQVRLFLAGPGSNALCDVSCMVLSDVMHFSWQNCFVFGMTADDFSMKK